MGAGGGESCGSSRDAAGLPWWVPGVGDRPTDRPTGAAAAAAPAPGEAAPSPGRCRGSVPWVGAVGSRAGLSPGPGAGFGFRWEKLLELPASGYEVLLTREAGAQGLPALIISIFIFFFFSSWENVGSKKNFRRK